MIATGKRMIVCGSRYGIQPAHLTDARHLLVTLWSLTGPIELCHGDGSGVDTWAESVLASFERKRVRVFPPGCAPGSTGYVRGGVVPKPMWTTGAAGPRRTMAMCRFVSDHGGGWVVAFPGGAGTSYGPTYGRAMALDVIDLRSLWRAPTRPISKGES